MRRKLVVGNWKMNLGRDEAASLVGALQECFIETEAEIGVCPAYLSIGIVRRLLEGSPTVLCAQDVFWLDSGAYTGQVSASMLADAGVRMCLVGHSETRGRFGKLDVPESTLPYFSETDETVNLKIKALLKHRVAPILCVGETLEEREAERTDAVIQSQIRGALAGVSEFTNGVVAYEPVWAIGTGKTCDAAEASRVCGVVRAAVRESLGGQADSIRVLYGGSVKAANAKELFGKPDIDGGLVGGASLQAEEFCRIVSLA